MNQKISVWLDVVRFLAALVVFIGHASNGHISGGLFWQVYPYLQSSVIVFFVLSGYVIAHVTDEKTPSLAEYTRDRFARIHSVLLPALVLTALCDTYGSALNPAHYQQFQPIYHGDQILRYGLSVFVMQNFWNWDFYPGTNGPTWSLCYEVTYYALWASAIWARGAVRLGLLLAFAILSGPSVVSLFPVWLLGVLAYRLNRRRMASGRQIPYARSLAALLFLAFMLGAPVIRANCHIGVPYLRPELPADYFDALMFTGILLLAPSMLARLRLVDGQVRAVRYFAQATFVIYLFHYPLLRMFTVFRSGPAASLANWVLLYPVSFVIMMALVPLTTRLQHLFKHWTGAPVRTRMP